MPESLDITAFLNRARMEAAPILDVRSPAEFTAGHIPHAVNLPLFSDEERARVGTLYKEQGREPAILIGLDIVGVKMRSFVEQTHAAVEQHRASAHNDSKSAQKSVLVHCWRGGMRSSSMAWLLNLCGFRVCTLQGGYKAFRRHVASINAQMRRIVVLGGKTGSQKTRLLHLLREKGEDIVDIEQIAQHKGSAFGALGHPPQPTQEQFENDIATVLADIPPDKRLWIEDESRLVGKCIIPEPLWVQLRAAPVLFLEVPFERRINTLVAEYGSYPKEHVREALLRIERRLGGLQTRLALEALEQGNIAQTAAHALAYYDKTYTSGLSLREKESVHPVSITHETLSEQAQMLLTATEQILPRNR